LHPFCLPKKFVIGITIAHFIKPNRKILQAYRNITAFNKKAKKQLAQLECYWLKNYNYHEEHEGHEEQFELLCFL